MNKPLKVGLTLGIVCLCAAGVIAGTYALTYKTIETNNQKRIEKALASIYEGATFSDKYNLSGLKYCQYYYEAKQEEVTIGYVYFASGTNGYGDISLMVGINADYTIKNNISVIKNTQSYASTLKNNYINPLINGERELDDVSCGATYGATLIKNMVNEAQEECKGGNAHVQK